ncbi:Copine-1 [Acropora cervicornis]|uniref:Copine-1 n=1 Tax=Acropora cervicornis TaxID=6130 RepID=A0AAD9VFN2_ACRCE|nr:Copine-1 [Acropora cervicornis]
MASKEEENKSTISLRNYHLASEGRHTAGKAWHSDARGGVLTQSSTLNTNAFQTKRKLELFLRCTDLVLLDSFTKSDPMCVLYVKKFGQWMEYGRTESIPNCLQPKFVETFIIEANKTMYSRLRFSVFDLANFTSKDLRKHDFIGSFEIEMESLLDSVKAGSMVRTLRLPGDIKSRGYVHVYVEDVIDSRTNVRLHFGAINLAKKGLLGKCDAFFEVNRWICNVSRFHPVYRSEIVTRTAAPKWAPFDISLQKLCNDNVDGQILVSCWHFSNSGNHSILGEARLPIKTLFHRTIRQVDIVNPVKQNKNKRYSNSGTLRILHCHVDKQFSLVDYVRGNCVIRMVCALDFTMSNGTPLTKGSLHTSDEEKNEYVRTLAYLGKVLATFGEDHKIPAYGFGAKAASTGPLPYIIIDAYWKRLEDVSLGGPTYLAPVVQEIAAYAEKEVSQSSQHYTIGLVIVDGIVNDVDNLIEKLIDIGHLPLSIVVEELFSKNRRQLRSKEGKTLVRNNTDFLSVRRHANNLGNNDSTAREIFANISQQIVTFFKSKTIVPNLPTKWNIKQPWDDWNATSELTTSRPSSPRMRKISQNVTARCPTCGSVIEPGGINKISG